jgi:hypothetical protein
MSETKEEAQYEYIKKQGKPLFENIYVLKVTPESTVK